MKNNGYYITSEGKRVWLKKRRTIFLSNNNIIELKIPEGVITLFCWNNQLTELDLPEGIKKLFCYNNRLAELDLPESIDYIACDPIKIKGKGIDNLNKIHFIV